MTELFTNPKKVKELQVLNVYGLNASCFGYDDL